MEPSDRYLTLHTSGRLAYVSKADGGEPEVEVSQPSDCLALQRDDIVCDEIVSMEVLVGYRFTTMINGPAEPEPPCVWQRALQHLLTIYQPQYCYIHTEGTETGLGEEVRVEVAGKGVYIGYWDGEQDRLCITK